LQIHTRNSTKCIKQNNMKVLLVVSVILAIHVTCSDGSLVDKLKDLLKREENREQAAEAERQLQEKRKEDQEEALLEKLVDELKSHNEKKGLSDWFNGVVSGAGDAFGNLGESAADVFNINSDEAEDIDLPSDLSTSGSQDPCKKAVFLENSSGNIVFPQDGGNYPRLENCEWVVNATKANKKIKLTFTFMDIRERGNCDDYVEVYAMECRPFDGHEYRGVDLTKKMCAEGIEKLPDNKKSFTVPTSCAYIHFRSNLWYNAKGFHLSYAFV